MIVFGWLAAVAGGILFHTALASTLRANPDVRIPFARNAQVVPAGSVTMRAVGAGLLVFAAVALSTAGWYVPLVIVVAGPIVALAVIGLHNRRVARRARGEQGIRRILPPRPWIATFDGVNWTPTSWGALLVVLVLAVLAGVVLSWFS